MHQYADDCQLHLAYEAWSYGDGHCRNKPWPQEVCEWSASYGFCLNISKCTILHISPWGNESVSIGSRELTVILDDKLTFSDHITQNIEKVLCRLRGMYKVRGLLPEPAKLCLVQALIHYIFQYCYPAYIWKQCIKGGHDWLILIDYYYLLRQN